MRLDDNTFSFVMGRFARVAVEIDTARALRPGTDVELQGLVLTIFWQEFEYEHIQLLCGSCGKVRHQTTNCDSRPSACKSFADPLFPSANSDDVMTFVDNVPSVIPNVDD